MCICMYGYEPSGLVKDFHLKVFGVKVFWVFFPLNLSYEG